MNTFDSQIYTDLDISIKDFMMNKLYNVHRMLYNEALKRLIENENISEDANTFIEVITSKNFYDPSSVIVVSRTYPFKKTNKDLTSYWPSYQFLKEAYKMPYEYTVEYKDYVNGKYKMHSKFFDENRNSKFNTLNSHFEGGE